MNKAIFSLLIAGFLSACSPQPASQEKTLYVSILPIRSLVKEIVDEDFRIEVLVPPGASPETFEPTPRQFIGLNEAQLVFNVGLLEFETALLDKIEDRTKIVDLSRGIVRIEGSCAHAGRNGSDHAHGVDPHVWTSPRALQRMAENAYEAIHARWPDSAKYTANHARLQEELRQLDLRTAEKIARSGIRYFIIYHPALTYYARDYGLRQEAVEADGKEPSAKRLTALIRQARKDGIGRILYQSQFPVSVVETIARDIGAECTEIDPLREDAIANIDSITDLIVRPQ
ncbi:MULTISPECIES: metal ABC transporter solute-binding protein, Zn/Mn family [Alistipes]|uniref:metal ABC transporter solute-binding protein, Zn/Mn family n=1 Tax=Alistipes TaxID=239759 RepID=UPI001B3718CA|nr:MULTISPECIES: zinc ABC transporter substrate-binding protein [Alistipes]MBQ4903529.1 zinc ABC transporter substrate-binding protein [Alistipes sp. Marseille-P2263]MCI2259285.1 zinc ABC transporter substrate-binding protein [Alistipes dispar]